MIKFSLYGDGLGRNNRNSSKMMSDEKNQPFGIPSL